MPGHAPLTQKQGASSRQTLLKRDRRSPYTVGVVPGGPKDGSVGYNTVHVFDVVSGKQLQPLCGNKVRGKGSSLRRKVRSDVPFPPISLPVDAKGTRPPTFRVY